MATVELINLVLNVAIIVMLLLVVKRNGKVVKEDVVVPRGKDRTAEVVNDRSYGDEELARAISAYMKGEQVQEKKMQEVKQETISDGDLQRVVAAVMKAQVGGA